MTNNDLETDIDLLKKELKQILELEKYNIKKINKIKEKVLKLNNEELNNLLADIYYNWALNLSTLAESEVDTRKQELYKESFDKSQIVTQIRPNDSEAFNNWGVDLGRLAKMFFLLKKEEEKAKELYQQAFDKYEKAVKIKPDNYEAFYNWRKDLEALAEITSPKEYVSYTGYKEVVNINSELYEAYYSKAYNLESSTKNEKIALHHVELDGKRYTFHIIKDMREPCGGCGVLDCGKENILWYEEYNQRISIFIDTSYFDLAIEEFFEERSSRSEFNSLPSFMKDWAQRKGWEDYDDYSDGYSLDIDDFLTSLKLLVTAEMGGKWITEENIFYMRKIAMEAKKKGKKLKMVRW